MDLILFYYFSMLEKYRSFSIAAEAVYLSQSSFSKRIKSLENKLGAELFVRKPRSVELTDIGQQLLPYAQNITAELECLWDDIDKRGGSNSALRIVAVSLLSYYGVTERIMEFMSKYPQINLGLREINSDIGCELLESGQADAVLMFVEQPFAEKFVNYPLGWDEMVGIMNPAHPLARKKQLTIRDLCGEELVMIAEHDEPFFQRMVRNCTKQAELVAHILPYRVWIGAIESIVRQSESVAVLPFSVAERMDQSAIIWRRIEGLPPFSFSIVTRANDHKAALQYFIKYLINNNQI